MMTISHRSPNLQLGSFQGLDIADTDQSHVTCYQYGQRELLQRWT